MQWRGREGTGWGTAERREARSRAAFPGFSFEGGDAYDPAVQVYVSALFTMEATTQVSCVPSRALMFPFASILQPQTSKHIGRRRD